MKTPGCSEKSATTSAAGCVGAVAGRLFAIFVAGEGQIEILILRPGQYDDDELIRLRHLQQVANLPGLQRQTRPPVR